MVKNNVPNANPLQPPIEPVVDSGATKLQELSGFEVGQLEDQVIANLSPLLKRWLPYGKRRGNYWLAANPKTKSGALSVSLLDGRWREFPHGESDKSIFSLVQHLTGQGRAETQHKLSAMLEQKR